MAVFQQDKRATSIEHRQQESVLFYDELKAVSTTQMEEAITKAITELVGHEYVCSITTVDFNNAFSAKLAVSLKRSNSTDIPL